MLGKYLQALLSKFLFCCAFFGTDKGPGKYEGVFDQVGNIKDECAATCFAVHNGKAVGDAQYPKSGGGEAIG